ncbi:hypothetical protein KY363_01750 [Candidatus Woesearchaeota archaeon]|nr:hypothetical protein [Candidatus Woesearchaeota archaeon]
MDRIYEGRKKHLYQMVQEMKPAEVLKLEKVVQSHTRTSEYLQERGMLLDDAHDLEFVCTAIQDYKTQSRQSYTAQSYRPGKYSDEEPFPVSLKKGLGYLTLCCLWFGMPILMVSIAKACR